MTAALTLALLLLAPPPADWPPMPDFETRFDYDAWVQAHIRGELDPGENAAELYRRIYPPAADLNAPFPEHLRAGSARQPGQPPQPWKPAEHADWEQAWQRMKETLAGFKQAAARPFYQFPRLEQPGESEWMRGLIISRRLSHIPLFQACTLALSEAAWRAPEGRVDAKLFLDTCETRLRAARQLEREPMLISMMVAMDARYLTYEDLRCALHHKLLSAAERRQALDLLAREDAPLAPYAHFLATECAAPLELLQAMARREPSQSLTLDPDRYRELAARVEPPRLDGSKPTPPAGDEISGIKPDETAKLLHQHYTQVAEMTRRGYPHVTAKEIAELERAAAQRNGFVRRFMPAVARGYALRTCCTAERRATRLVVALFVFQDQHDRWPASLAELPREVVSDSGTDPFTGKPFAYELRDGEPLLYTVGPDGKDDGGRHSPMWRGAGDTPPDGDGVFWPIAPAPVQN